IIFVWTPPHFWALALLRTGDYAKAGVPMLPVVAGADATRAQILIYSLILAPLGLAPVVVGLGGALYAAAASALWALFLSSWPSTVIANAKARRPIAPPRTCSATRCSTSSCSLPCCSSSKVSALTAGGL